MIKCELDEMINAVENGVVKNAKTITLTPHRWGQLLRILKFYSLKWNELEKDALWDGDQSLPDSPYFHKGYSQRQLYEMHKSFLHTAARK